MLRRLTLCVTLLLAAPAALADAVPTLRPQARPAAEAVPAPVLRPLRRPGAEAAAADAAKAARVLAAETLVAILRVPPSAAADAARAEAEGIAAAAVAALSPAADPAPPAILVVAPARDRLAPAPDGSVVTSTAGTLAPPDAAGAVRAAFVPVAPLATGPRARPGAAVVLPAVAVLPPLRPQRRPAADAPAPAVAAAVIARRPVARPASLVVPAPAAVAPSAAPRVALGILPRPELRPKGLARKAAKAARAAEAAPETVTLAAAVRVDPGSALVKPKKGSVCGDRAIRGETLAPIPGKVAGCGIAAPVRVTEVAGVRLSPAATLDCSAAAALKTWVERALKPAAGRRGVAELKVAASYACRPRNNIRGNKISEHGKGRAIDIAAVVLGDGRVLNVLTDYKTDSARVLRSAHKAACGIFGTTLGPGSDGFHENHLHFDTAAYRSGPYCR